MIKINNFQQNQLIERIDEILHPKNKVRLDEDCPGVFRNSFLQMMPVENLGKHLHAKKYSAGCDFFKNRVLAGASLRHLLLINFIFFVRFGEIYEFHARLLFCSLFIIFLNILI